MSPIRSYRTLDSATKRIVQVAAIAIVALAFGLAVSLSIGFGASSKGDTANQAARIAASAAAKAQGAADVAAAAAQTAQDFAQADCSTWHDLAVAPPSPQTTNFTLFVDFRIGYERKGCVALTGKLPPPDPRVKALLPPGID